MAAPIMSGGNFSPAPQNMSKGTTPSATVTKPTLSDADILGFDDSGTADQSFAPPPSNMKSLSTGGIGTGTAQTTVPKPRKKAGSATSAAGAETVFDTTAQDGTPNQQDSRLVSPKAKYSAQQEQNEAVMMAQAVKSPPVPLAFSGLQLPGGLTVEYEPNQAIQVETSDSLLRSLSPFMLRIEPPLVYGEDGGFQNKKLNSVATDFSVGSGFGTDATGYNTARKAIAQSGLSGLSTGGSKVQSIQETVVMPHGSGPQTGRTPTGTKTDAKGGGNMGVPAIADLYTAVDQARQLSAMFNTPPLVLLINPTTFSVAYNKIMQYTEKSRYGFIFQAWGEEQPKISFTARCGAFISGERGVQFAARRDSKAWQNLMNAFHIFRNAGYIHDTVGKSNAHLMVGSVSIRYDGWIYYGQMESFNFTHDEEHMHGGVEFSIEFVVSSMVDTGQQTFSVAPMKSPIPSLSDPRYQGIQNQSLNQAGEFSVGFDVHGNPVLQTQGRDVGVGDAFLSTVPSNAVSVFNPNAGFRTPAATQIGTRPLPKPSASGFTQSTAVTPGQKTVTTANPNLVDPFRVRSST